jgi:hypothetical protein
MWVLSKNTPNHPPLDYFSTESRMGFCRHLGTNDSVLGWSMPGVLLISLIFEAQVSSFEDFSPSVLIRFAGLDMFRPGQFLDELDPSA